MAWAEKFRIETSEAAEQPESVTLDILRRSQVPRYIARPLKPVGRGLDRVTRPFGLAEYPLHVPRAKRRAGDVAFARRGRRRHRLGPVPRGRLLQPHRRLRPVPHCFGLGFLTLVRVAVLVVVSTLIWVPIGVKIGMSPRLSRYAQPVVQVLASFPANFLFPFAIVVFVGTGLSLNIGGIFLMALGAQWYILFNVIAGASAIPTDLRELIDQFARAPQPAVATADPAGHLPRLRHRRDHRRRGGVERVDRGRGRHLRQAPPGGQRPRRLHRPGHRRAATSPRS